LTIHSLQRSIQPAHIRALLERSSRPAFATDATKFALFCTAVAEALKSGLIPAVPHPSPRLACCFSADPSAHHQDYRTSPTTSVYTIHISRFRGSGHSRAIPHPWRRGSGKDPDDVRRTPIARGPRWPNCVNRWRRHPHGRCRPYGLPSYAEEILAQRCAALLRGEAWRRTCMRRTVRPGSRDPERLRVYSDYTPKNSNCRPARSLQSELERE